MRPITHVSIVFCLGLSLQAAAQVQQPDWAMNATIIEACSCPMFCQCYFNTSPAAHGGHQGHGAEHFCRFNNAFRVNKGHYGNIALDGAKFWIAGDLGGDFSRGQMDWAVIHFDPSLTPQQRDGIMAIMTHVYPVKWNSFTTGSDAPIDWHYDKDTAEARLDEGKIAQVVLKRYPGNTDDPIVIRNLRYWGVPRNDGFVLMPNQVEALRQAPAGRQPFEFSGTNGFMITFDINSTDIAGAQKQSN